MAKTNFNNKAGTIKSVHALFTAAKKSMHALFTYANF